MNNKGLRILLLGDSRSFHIERYVPELKRQNCEVLLASIEDGAVEHYQLKRVGPIRQLHYTLGASELRQLISKYRPDIVDVQDANYGYMAALVLRSSDMPVNLQLLGSDILIASRKTYLHRMKTVFALRRADAIVADSLYLLEQAKKLTSLKRTLVEPFGFEENYLKFHKRIYALSRPLKIIVTRLQEKVYNNFFILKSLAPLLKAGSIILRFADFGSLAVDMKSAVTQWRLPNVHFYVKSEREPFLKLMSEHDVYLSAAFSDSSPVSLIDAMALGLIPVVAKIPGIMEWSENSGAFTFINNNANELTGIIEKIISENSAHSEMRIGNLTKVKAIALFENNVAARIDLMKKIVGQT